jgi:hypothetical protein
MNSSVGFWLPYPPFVLSVNPFMSYQNTSQPMPVLAPEPSELKLDPASKKYARTWTKPEIQEVFNSTVFYCLQHGKDISELTISDFAVIAVGKKQTPEQIMIKIKEVNKNGTLRPGKWSQDEDDLLASLVAKYGRSWGQIAVYLNNEVHNKLNIRNSKSCKERWNNHLNPDINRSSWTKEEDKAMLIGYLKVGRKWKEISRMVPTGLRER